jgi:hypothetical protein
MNFLRNVINLVFTYLIIIPALYASIWVGHIDTFLRERHYKLFNIPYYKGKTKFGHYIKRLDK